MASMDVIRLTPAKLPKHILNCYSYYFNLCSKSKNVQCLFTKVRFIILDTKRTRVTSNIVDGYKATIMKQYFRPATIFVLINIGLECSDKRQSNIRSGVTRIGLHVTMRRRFYLNARYFYKKPGKVRFKLACMSSVH